LGGAAAEDDEVPEQRNSTGRARSLVDLVSRLFYKKFLHFAFTAASILISGGQDRLKPSPGSFFRRVDAEFPANGDFAW